MPPLPPFFPRQRLARGAVAVAVLLAGCHHSGPDPQPDPCAGQTRQPPPFKMLNQVGRASFDCDSMFLGTVVFAADPAYSSYEWKVGTDARTFTKQQFSVEFTQPVRVTVQLIGHRTPNRGSTIVGTETIGKKDWGKLVP